MKLLHFDTVCDFYSPFLKYCNFLKFFEKKNDIDFSKDQVKQYRHVYRGKGEKITEKSSSVLIFEDY